VIGQDLNVYALKRVSLQDAEPFTLECYKNEISILRKFKNQKTIIQLIDAEINTAAEEILLVTPKTKNKRKKRKEMEF
jgi:hypothetical protein